MASVKSIPSTPVSAPSTDSCTMNYDSISGIGTVQRKINGISGQTFSFSCSVADMSTVSGMIIRLITTNSLVAK